MKRFFISQLPFSVFRIEHLDNSNTKTPQCLTPCKSLTLTAGERHKYNPPMKRYLPWVAAVAIAFSALALVSYGQKLADEELMSHDQDVIDGCWQEAKGTELTPTQVQVTIEACMDLEAVYRYNWGIDPRPQSMGV